MACITDTLSDEEEPVARNPIQFQCQSCRKPFESTEWGTLIECTECGEKLSRIMQLDQLLEQWFYPRRWRADLHEPNPYYLLEKLWTANGQGATLYNGIAPQYTNYDVFRNLVTRLVARGVDEGWVELEFPDDPLEENPVYQLKFNDPDRFAKGVERLFPEVDWDEQIEVPMPEAPAGDEGLLPDITASIATDDAPADEPATAPTSIVTARRARRSRQK
jgi:DNA-directed RNA polymerase subunit RPC12/RpoP